MRSELWTISRFDVELSIMLLFYFIYLLFYQFIYYVDVSLKNSPVIIMKGSQRNEGKCLHFDAKI